MSAQMQLHNPFIGARLYVYPVDRPMTNPRILEMKPLPMESSDEEEDWYGQALGGAVVVKLSAARTLECRVRGKVTERFTVKWHGRQNRARFNRM